MSINTYRISKCAVTLKKRSTFVQRIIDKMIFAILPQWNWQLKRTTARLSHEVNTIANNGFW